LRSYESEMIIFTSKQEFDYLWKSKRAGIRKSKIL